MVHIIYILWGSNIGIVQKIKLTEGSYLRWLFRCARPQIEPQIERASKSRSCRNGFTSGFKKDDFRII